MPKNDVLSYLTKQPSSCNAALHESTQRVPSWPHGAGYASPAGATVEITTALEEAIHGVLLGGAWDSKIVEVVEHGSADKIR